MVEIDEYGRRKNRHYTGPPGQGNGGHLEPLTGLRHTRTGEGSLWGEYDDFISDIGHWFEDNGQTMPAYLAFAGLAIVAILVVWGIVRTWCAGNPFSAIITAVICGVVAVRGFWLFLGILYGGFWLVFFTGRLIFKNAAWFTIEVIIVAGIYYFSTHQEALATIIEFAQSLGVYPASQLR